MAKSFQSTEPPARGAPSARETEGRLQDPRTDRESAPGDGAASSPAPTAPPGQLLAVPVQRRAKGPSAGAAGSHWLASRLRAGTGDAPQEIPHRGRLERAFGRPLSRRHGFTAYVGPNARRSAEALGARGYVHDGAMVLGASPSLETVAEETAHLLQGEPAPRVGRPAGVTDRASAAEGEARQAAGRAAEGRSAGPVTAALSPAAVARSDDPEKAMASMKAHMDRVMSEPEPEVHNPHLAQAAALVTGGHQSSQPQDQDLDLSMFAPGELEELQSSPMPHHQVDDLSDDDSDDDKKGDAKADRSPSDDRDELEHRLSLGNTRQYRLGKATYTAHFTDAGDLADETGEKLKGAKRNQALRALGLGQHVDTRHGPGKKDNALKGEQAQKGGSFKWATDRHMVEASFYGMERAIDADHQFTEVGLPASFGYGFQRDEASGQFVKVRPKMMRVVRRKEGDFNTAYGLTDESDRAFGGFH